MSVVAFGTRLEGERARAWFAVKSHVLGQMGISEKPVGNAENFLILANKLYGLNVPTTGDFEEAICRLHSDLNDMSKNARRMCRRRNVALLGYDVSPNAIAVKRAAIKAKKAKREKTKGQPSAKKVAARDAYRKQHLVMVTKDGKELFGNVMQHSPKEAREEFYKSWDWRTARMEVLKRHARRCMCCGSTPDDLTVDGKPVRLVVDHIKPLSRYWHLRLVQSNLQILCDECNMGKGAWDETDHRSESERLIAQQLTYEIGGAA